MRWLLVLLAVFFVTLAGIGWWSWKERVMLVNLALDRVAPEIVVEVKRIEWDGAALHLSEVRVWWRADGAGIATVREVEWTPEWQKIRTGELGRIKIEDAVIDADIERLRGLSSGGSGGAAKVWKLAEIVLDETPVTLRDAQGVWFAAKVTPHAEEIEIGGASPKVKLAELRARDVVWRDHPLLAELRVTARTTPEGIEILKVSAADAAVDLGWFTADEAGASSSGGWPRGVIVHEAALANVRVKAADFHGLEAGLRFSWRGSELVWKQDAKLALGAHELDVTEIQLRPKDGAGEITVESLHVEAVGLGNICTGRLVKPRVRWTQALEDALIHEGGEKSETKLQIDSWSLVEGDVAFESTKRLPVNGSLKIAAELRGLDSSLQSAQKQRLSISELQTAWKTLEPFFSAKAISVEITPDDLRERFWVDALKIEEPSVTLNPENGPWFEKIAVETEPVMHEQPFWKRLGFGKLEINAAKARMTVPLAERLELEAGFEVKPVANGAHLLMVQQARAMIPSRTHVPVGSLREAEITMRLPEMWSGHRVEQIVLRSGHADVGDALMTLFRGPAEVAEQKVQAVAERWTANAVEVRDIGVTLEEVAPQFPPLHFSVNFTAKETPLDLEGLAENVEPQQITLKNLRIPSPHRPLNAVAEMAEIQVRYTLDGLLKRRIDRVDIVGPMLFVGEDLFWYVENYRKFMDGEAVLADAFVGPVQPPKPEAPGWKVDTLAVSEGRLVVAPKGVPVRGLGEPFPFSFVTKLESGELNAELQIPEEDREIAHLKLHFTGLRGKVQFNLPMKEKSNNVVEVFQAEGIRWKNLQAENAHLSITYDRNGIYGSLYGKAYGGDINGAFNIYLDDSYTWDGWLAVTKIRSGPVTKALFPQYFLLDGTVTGKIVATGDGDELYQGDVEFLNDGRGRFEISALNDFINELPKPMRGDLSEQIRRIGLETLRDFDYDSVDGKARFYGREGRGHLRFAGPDGKRTFEINVYDHRYADKKTP